MNKNIIGWSLLGTQLYKLLLFCQRKTGNNLNFIESCCLILSNESCGFLQRTEALDHLLDISKSQSKEVVLQSQCFLESKVSSVEHIELGASVTLKLTVLSHAPLDIIVDRVILFIEKDDSRPVETNMNPSNLFKNLLESNTNITIQNAKYEAPKNNEPFKEKICLEHILLKSESNEVFFHYESTNLGTFMVTKICYVIGGVIFCSTFHELNSRFCVAPSTCNISLYSNIIEKFCLNGEVHHVEVQLFSRSDSYEKGELKFIRSNEFIPLNTENTTCLIKKESLEEVHNNFLEEHKHENSLSFCLPAILPFHSMDINFPFKIQANITFIEIIISICLEKSTGEVYSFDFSTRAEVFIPFTISVVPHVNLCEDSENLYEIKIVNCLPVDVWLDDIEIYPTNSLCSPQITILEKNIKLCSKGNYYFACEKIDHNAKLLLKYAINGKKSQRRTLKFSKELEELDNNKAQFLTSIELSEANSNVVVFSVVQVKVFIRCLATENFYEKSLFTVNVDSPSSYWLLCGFHVKEFTLNQEGCATLEFKLYPLSPGYLPLPHVAIFQGPANERFHSPPHGENSNLDVTFGSSFLEPAGPPTLLGCPMKTIHQPQWVTVLHQSRNQLVILTRDFE